jgi:hypothetical protein
VPFPIKAIMVDDKAALAGQLRRWAELPSLRRILVSHGSPIERDAPQILHALARSLD